MEERISLERAVELELQGLAPLGAEGLELSAALGRTLAEDFAAGLDQPPFDRSPLDGYTLRGADIAGASPEQPVSLTVVDTVYAGDVPRAAVGPGQAVQVTTGAMLPPGCDCVIRQEDTRRDGPTVRILRPVAPGQNYIRRGADFRAGQVLLPAGTRLSPAAIGLLSSAGAARVAVRRRPSVGLITTGDEVALPGAPLPSGKIYGSNGLLLSARLRQLGIRRVVTGHVADDPAQAAAVMAGVLESCDLLLTTGGVSVGERDILHQALPLLGAEQIYWRVNLKPGTPALFSRHGGKPILSLSGNPFAAAATFELLAVPLLSALSGEDWLLPRRTRAIIDTPFPKASPTRRFLRGRWADGHVTLPPGHSSGQLASLVGCNCLVELPAGSPPLERGTAGTVYLLSGQEAF